MAVDPSLCQVEKITKVPMPASTDINKYECNAGCLCKAIATAAAQPTWSMPTSNGLAPASALQPGIGVNALFDTHHDAAHATRAAAAPGAAIGHTAAASARGAAILAAKTAASAAVPYASARAA